MKGPSLTLFIAGHTVRSQNAIRQLRLMAMNELGNNCELTVVDVVEKPDLAEQARVLATPTLIKESPAPVRRIIGDLSDIQKVMTGLGLCCCAQETEEESVDDRT